MRAHQKKVVIGSAFLVVILTYLLIVNFALKPTLQIGSIKIGPVTEKTLEPTLRSYLKTKKIVLKSETASKTYSLDELGIFFEEQSINNIVKQPQKTLSRFTVMPVRNCCELPLPEMVIDLSRLDFVWQKDLAVQSGESKNATLTYKKDLETFQVSDAVVGLSFDAVAAKQAIIKSARNTTENVTTIQASDVSQKINAKIQKSELLAASEEASKIVNHKVSITVEGTVITPPKETIASWLVLKIRSGSQPKIAVDSGRIATYLTDVSKKYYIDPTIQIVKSGQITQQGKNGRAVTNIESASKLMQQALSEETDQSVNAVLSVADIPFRTTDVTPRPKQVNAKYKYRIFTKGAVQADVNEFRAQVQETLSSNKGWPASGATFQEVGSNADFDISLTQPSVLGSYGGCSAEYSCRSGRLVMINDERWRSAVPHWNLSLRDYRHMVVNHEVGHWLGLSHVDCQRSGSPAPLMQQQSISLQGCTANPWPTDLDRSKLR